jgi:hypothetical protein
MNNGRYKMSTSDPYMYMLIHGYKSELRMTEIQYFFTSDYCLEDLPEAEVIAEILNIEHYANIEGSGQYIEIQAIPEKYEVKYIDKEMENPSVFEILHIIEEYNNPDLKMI